MTTQSSFEKEGYASTAPLFSSAEITTLIAQLEAQTATEQGPRRGGLRDVVDNLPAMRELASDPRITAPVNAILPNAFLVRATLFDKTEASNWKVPWHQDVTIAVAERHETAGYGPWSIKNGIPHVQPPTEILQHMLTVRLHLDDCPASNGALRVLPRSHALGRIKQNEVAPHIDESRAIICEVPAGAVLLMRPLLLHASSTSETPGHRRVVHFDFANGPLHSPLRWKMNPHLASS